MTLGVGIEQFYVFVAFVAFGALFALPYLFLRGFFHKKIFSHIFDAIYGVATAFFVWKINLEINNGEFRLFVPLAFVVGVAISRATCKTALDNLSSRLYNLFKRRSDAQWKDCSTKNQPR